jgi:hypothetical protein
MSFRRSAALALAAAALVSGCKKVDQEPSPAEIVVAAFNSPACSDANPLLCAPAAIPTPNDLALQAVEMLSSTSAQRALLQAFVTAGGFPTDQAVGITIPIKRLTFDAASSKYVLASYAQSPLVDPTTLTTAGASRTLVVLKIDGPSPVEQTVEVDAANCTTGQIALVKAKDPTRGGTRVWAPGRYVFAMRAGAVRTTTGTPIDADQAVALVWPNKDLTNPNNQPPGGLPQILALQADAVRKSLWQPVSWGNVGGLWMVNGPGNVSAFGAVAPYFAPEQIAVIGTFQVTAGENAIPIAPMPTTPVDAASGIAPLPLDLLRTANSGTTIAYNQAFGPAALGLTTLDGFSTTAMILAPSTMPLDADTVNGATVRLVKLKGGATVLKELKQEFGIFQATGGLLGEPWAADYVAEPDPITITSQQFFQPGAPCLAANHCSLLVGLQPAAGTDAPPALAPYVGSKITMPPLDEATDYAVIITTGVRDMLGRPLQKATVAKILVDPGFDAVATSTVNGQSLLAGMSDATATALAKMRFQLAQENVLGAAGLTANDVALAYTFRTQSGIASTGQLNALALAGLPYGKPVGISPDPDAVTTFSTDATAALYGIDPAILASASGAIAEFAEVKVETVSWLLNSHNQGAFDPFHPTTETVTALVAIPDLSRVLGTCAGSVPCAPLVVFEHGLGSSKAEVLPIAASLADKGFIVAAIDQPLQGERSYCSGSGANAQAAADAMCCPAAVCGAAGASHCAFKANLTTPVDADANGVIQIGVCELDSAPGTRGRVLNHRLDSATTPSPKGVAFASANRFVSMNFFRVRDTLRQDVIDVSSLIKALAPLGPSADPFATYLATRSQGLLAVDSSKVYWIGHSFGVFAGTASLAANPRISRAVTYAGGATAIDVFANPQSYYNASLIQLLAGAGVAPGTPDFLKFLQIGKWILDPADPANFAPYVVPAEPGQGLPSPLGGKQPSRQVLTQVSLCDGTVPNTQNTLLSGLLGRRSDGTSLVDATFGDWRIPAPASGTTSRTQWFSMSSNAVCPGDAVGHSNPWNFATSAALAWKTQAEMAGFLSSPSPSNATTPVTP